MKPSYDPWQKVFQCNDCKGITYRSFATLTPDVCPMCGSESRKWTPVVARRVTKLYFFKNPKFSWEVKQ